jgi:hypothetical protein
LFVNAGIDYFQTLAYMFLNPEKLAQLPLLSHRGLEFYTIRRNNIIAAPDIAKYYSPARTGRH